MFVRVLVRTLRRTPSRPSLLPLALLLPDGMHFHGVPEVLFRDDGVAAVHAFGLVPGKLHRPGARDAGALPRTSRHVGDTNEYCRRQL